MTAIALEPLVAGMWSVLVFGGLLLAAHLRGAVLARTMAGFGLLLGAFAAVAPAGSWPLPPLGRWS